MNKFIKDVMGDPADWFTISQQFKRAAAELELIKKLFMNLYKM